MSRRARAVSTHWPWRGWRIVGFAALFAVLGGCAYVDTPDLGDAVPLGAPRAVDAGLSPRFATLANPGFALGYSDWRGNALWVAYRLTPVRARRDLPRPRRYLADPRTLRAVDGDAFRRSGYQRGHLAPNYAIAQVHGAEAQRAAFLMSNISPQRPRLNQKAWQRLEEVVIDHFAPRFGELWVTTGPIFDAEIEALPSGVEIPDAFYKLVLINARDREPRVLAFRMPQTVRGTERLSSFLVTVDRIEAETGLDFFADLDDAREAAMESRIDVAGWDLDAVDALPPRY